MRSGACCGPVYDAHAAAPDGGGGIGCLESVAPCQGSGACPGGPGGGGPGVPKMGSPDPDATDPGCIAGVFGGGGATAASNSAPREKSLDDVPAWAEL